MLKGLSKVVALSGNIEKGSVMELLFDRSRSELFGFKHKVSAGAHRHCLQGSSDNSLDTVLLATLNGPVTAEWVISQLTSH